jgi:hypothetical protein
VMLRLSFLGGRVKAYHNASKKKEGCKDNN